MNHKFNTFLSLFALAAASNSALAQEDLYQTLVFEGGAQSAELIRGDAEEAVAQLTGKFPEGRSIFSVQNNLCVAYIALKDVEAATKSCDTAVRASRRQLSVTEVFVSHSWHTRRAIALTNRGVLAALRGQTEAATADFQKAGRLDSSLSGPRANLQRLLAKTELAQTVARHTE
ncbi:MAG: hypothetical protein AB8G16_00200 [Gammaproteobacteria bacterium]